MLHAWVTNLPGRTKRLILLALDTALLPIALFLAFALRFGGWPPDSWMAQAWPLFPLVGVGGFLLFIPFRLDRYRIRTYDGRAILRFGAYAVALTFLTIAISYTFDIWTPRSVPPIFGAVFFIGAVLVRLLAQAALQISARRASDRVPVAVYGAGAAGVQLVSAMRLSADVEPVSFIDDNMQLHGVNLAGLVVRPPSSLAELVRRGKVQRILIAIPSVTRERRAEIIAGLQDLGVDVQVLPSFVEMMDGRALQDSLRAVTPNDLLGRDSVDLDIPEIAKAYAGRTVMVTGAGGSIGSELCRQLLACAARRIVLFERSEFALYTIDRDLRPVAEEEGIEIVTRLGSVTDRARVERVIADEGIEIILHAAAYKHVPMIEENELEGARNNTIGTQIVAEAARAAGIERFILISTDKAVRPTNIMGATKRLAELIIQDLQTRSTTTRFAMVRFGNVLGSSGSVLPLFQRQIALGGPVTVTDPNVTRYFMTIPEASRLVLLAGAFAERGDVFVLDMGEPRRIIDIARNMIHLAGLTVREPGSGTGDIEIEITGLRPGEKLYEELLIDQDGLLKTPHSKILRAEEQMLSQIEVAAMLKEINAALSAADAARLRAAMGRWVEGYGAAVAAGHAPAS